MFNRKSIRKVIRWFDHLDLEIKIVFSVLIPIWILFVIVYADLLFRWMVITTGGVIYLLLDKFQTIFQGVL